MKNKPSNPKRRFLLILSFLFLGLILITTLPQSKTGESITIQVMEGWQVNIRGNTSYEISTDSILPCIMQEVDTGNMFPQELVNGRYIGIQVLNYDSTWNIKTGDCLIKINSALPVKATSHPTKDFWIKITIIPAILIFSGFFILDVFKRSKS